SESKLTYKVFKKNTLAFLNQGISIFFSEVVPYGIFFDPTERVYALRNKNLLPPYTMDDYTKDVALQRLIFQQLKEEFSDQVNILKPSEWLCSSTFCNFDTGGYPNYFDMSHLTQVGVHRIRPMYEEIFIMKSN
ncbi:MAG: hypothetical protein D3923_08440, partial [Candidatus Electrothrix sp. AR3]|nr:hypothetical protein [Candidatus Electrothrix sp. AR3]